MMSSHACDWQGTLLAVLSSLLPAPLYLLEQHQPLLFSGVCAILNPWDVLVDTLFSSWVEPPWLFWGLLKQSLGAVIYTDLGGISKPFWSCSWRFKSSGISNESGDLLWATERAYSAGCPGSYSRLSIKGKWLKGDKQQKLRSDSFGANWKYLICF